MDSFSCVQIAWHTQHWALGLCVLQTAESSGGASLCGGGEGAPREETARWDQHCQAGGTSAPRTAGGHREWTEQAEIRWARTGAGKGSARWMHLCMRHASKNSRQFLTLLHPSEKSSDVLLIMLFHLCFSTPLCGGKGPSIYSATPRYASPIQITVLLVCWVAGTGQVLSQEPCAATTHIIPACHAEGEVLNLTCSCTLWWLLTPTPNHKLFLFFFCICFRRIYNEFGCSYHVFLWMREVYKRNFLPRKFSTRLESVQQS